LKAGLKIRQGHIDEVPGAGCRRPVGGRYWGLRGWGDLQWHVGVDPAPVETQVRGEPSRLTAPAANYGLGLNLHVVNAACSVACLEWYGRISVFQAKRFRARERLGC